MIGDTVIIGNGYYWKETDNQKVMAYMPKLDNHGQWISTDEKTVLVESVGGVLCGSVGKIDGNIIKVKRENIKSVPQGYNGNDFLEMVPVNLERYQRVGYFLIDNIRVSAPSL